MYDSMDYSGRRGRFNLNVCMTLMKLSSGKVMGTWVVRGLTFL